jgi:hypothetical protein
MDYISVEFFNVIQIIITSLEYLVTCEYFNSVFQFLVALSTYYCHVLVTIDRVWIGSWIYWTVTNVTTSNYNRFTNLHTL